MESSGEKNGLQTHLGEWQDLKLIYLKVYFVFLKFWPLK